MAECFVVFCFFATIPKNKMSQTTPFALKYRLRRQRYAYGRENVQALPENRCGVYALWLPSAVIDGYDCIYVGKSETCIRRRLLDHLQNEPNPGLRRVLRTFRDMVQFSVAFTANAAETDALETAIIRDWQPETNRNKL